MNKRNLGFTLIPLFLAVGLVGGMFIGMYLSSRQESPKEEKLRTILGLIKQEYVDEIDTDSLLEVSFTDLMAQLDPHSVYISAEEFESANDEIQGSFSGVGVSFQILNDTVQVIDVISGGPAEKVGITPGDRIIAADKVKLTGDSITNDLVFKTLRGEKGSKVVVEIKKFNQKEPVKFDIVRDDIPVNSIDSYYMIEPGIGYVDVSKFSRSTYTEFVAALTELRGKGAEKFIVDLRDNGGGLLDQVVLMANEFLPGNRQIVYTKGRRIDNQVNFNSDGTGKFSDVDLVVLTNEYSASASEIFAGAIQDNDRGLIIGRRTFGKGLVQNQTPLKDNSAIRLTVARYFTPSGRCIQKDYERGKDGRYLMDIEERYLRGEFYNADSIKLDKSKKFFTVGGRTVYGGGGIMPDIFVPQDTAGLSSYYMNVSNKALIQKYAYAYADKNREKLKSIKTLDQLLRALPDNDRLLEDFVAFAAKNGVPARWYYINQSRDLLLRNLKAIIARDVLGYSEMNQVLNQGDPTVERALKELRKGISFKK